MDKRFLPWTIDPAVRAAWQEQVHATAATPWRWRELGQHKDELFPRFAAIYHRLCALPRRVRRRLQRQWACSLAGVALLFALQPTTSWAANFTAGTDTELITAINSANSDSAADTITLTADITLIVVDNTDFTGSNGLPMITSPITIAGQGHTIHRDSGALDFRLLEVSSTGDLTLQDTTLSGGTTGVSYSYYGGGGIVLNGGGSLTLTNSTVSGNSAAGGRGGGISNFGGSVTLTNSTVSGNSAYSGGGIASNRGGGSLTLTNSTVSGNSASGKGGGITSFVNSDSMSLANSVTLTNSTVSDNSSFDSGGGIFTGVGNYGGGSDVTLTNSTVSGNSSVVGFAGGGIYNFGGSLTLTNSTVSGNSGAYFGGGIANSRGSGLAGSFEGSVTLTNSTVSGNSAGEGGGISSAYGHVTLSRSLISGNTAPAASEVFIPSYSSVTDTFNLLGHNGLTTAQAVSGFTPDPSDITATLDGNDPTALADVLDPTLQNNSGPTLTHNLVPGSPAIDAAGPDCPPPATDQRGVTRPLGAACDIGAVEFSFAFSGFFAPVDNPPVLNVVKAGQGIPVKFSLGGNQGLNIFETGYPKSQQIACDTAAPADDIEATVTAGNSSLSYNSRTDQYTYGWKTVTTWANTCRQFIMKLTNGAVRLANFQFKK